MRVIAILLLVAVLPTMELTEQLAHVIEHVLAGEVPSHSAHHDNEPGDEHGCTGLVHLCVGHQAPITTATAPRMRASETIEVVAIAMPPPLVDKNALEPLYRPPIG